MPIAILPFFILGVLSTAVLFGGGYIVYQWWHGTIASTAVLASGIAMLVVSALGRFAVLAFHRSRAKGRPSWSHDAESTQIERPDGTTLHVEFCGPSNGPAIVLTHGWGCDNRAFYYLKRQLSAKYRVISWDLRGLGKSSQGGKNDYSLDAMAGDLDAVLDLAAGPAVIVGHSIGGMVAQVFARRQAHRLSSDVVAMALVSTTYTDPMRTTVAAKVMSALERPLFVPLMYMTIGLSPILWAMNWLSYLNGTQIIGTALTGFAGTESSQQLDFASRFFVKASPGVLARGMLAMFKFDETASIGNIGVPVLVVTGDRDPVLLPAASKRIANAIPDAKLSMLSNSKHMGLMEQHESFGKTLGAFIEEQMGSALLEPTIAPKPTYLRGVVSG